MLTELLFKIAGGLAPNISTILLLLGSTVSIRAYARFRRSVALTPPGPTPLPLLGNIFDIPTQDPWITHLEWSRKYNSDLISVRAFGKLTIVINSAKAARELLTKRQAIYSNRPHMPMLKLMEWDWMAAFRPYGHDWRVQRRLMHQFLNGNVIARYSPIHSRYATRFVQNLLREPQGFTQHALNYISGTALMAAYGLEDDALSEIAIQSTELLSQSILLGSQLLNVLPWLAHLPEWLPGASFHRFARKSRELTRKLRRYPVDKVKRQLADGVAAPSLLLSMLDTEGKKPSDDVIMEVAAGIHAGAADTTYAALVACIQALVLYPEVQSRAQAEIDSVVGRDRLPVPADKPGLPYIEAICREVLRWHSVIPMGVPLESSEDDTYEGYLIPKGSTLIWNSWAISHDPDTYESPKIFCPERFLDENGKLTSHEEEAVFGYGKRICVGMYFAKASLWAAIASMLSTHTFHKVTDVNGEQEEIHVGQSSTFMSHRFPFRCDIRPRDEKAIQVIQSTMAD